MSIGLTTAMATGGIGAALATAFSQVRNVINSFRSVFICVTTYEDLSDMAFFEWIKSKRVYCFGDSTYFLEERHETSKIRFSLLKSRFRNKICIGFFPFPVIIKYDNTSRQAQMIYVRFTLNAVEIGKELFDIDIRCNLGQIEENRKAKENIHRKEYSNIVFVNGSLGNSSSKNEGTVDRPRTDPSSDSPSGEGKIANGGKGGVNFTKHTDRKYSETLKGFEYQLKQKTPFDMFYYGEDFLPVIKEVETWMNMRSWYKGMDIPWKRGMCLYGPPGTGKTSLIRNIAKTLGMDIYVFNLASFRDSEFLDSVLRYGRSGGVSDYNPSFFLFEDIDVVFNGRETTSKNTMQNPLTFSTFINAIDGICEINGVFFAVTTNNLSKIDPALLRPGRIDGCYEVKPFGREGQTVLAEKILSEWPEEIINVVTDSFVTGAEFKNKCLKIALMKKWKTENQKLLNHKKSVDLTT
ncbi:MAG: AAA family ATPase [Candidatus Methanomethylophilaceae archaeon]